ncbi:hypothetical protein FXN61_04400 [Lentzea sp. PSKA42]|uniref:Secreted protein n=1 Tax=Lentzea indica TaxID=2604800 RepID=A0ABX1FB16_9PSEU|nr:hypothetical protein [Lentzea indica]NKE56110.1 hypothetical protein [Lentzea indica]
MTRKGTRLLAAGAAAAALLSTTVPTANAATPPEATVAAYIYTDGTTSEALTAENANLSAPHLASGYTESHPGWDIRLSDETYGAGLPTQELRANASHTDTRASADSGGFVSLVDRDPRGVPFAVVKLGYRSYYCTVDGPYYTSDKSSPRLWLRQADGELYEIRGELSSWTSTVPPRFYNSPRIPTTVKVNRFTTPAELAAYPEFAKYDGRTNTGAGAYELQITQQDTTYRILVAAAAASC